MPLLSHPLPIFNRVFGIQDTHLHRGRTMTQSTPARRRANSKVTPQTRPAAQRPSRGPAFPSWLRPAVREAEWLALPYEPVLDHSSSTGRRC